MPQLSPARRERGHVEIETTDHESYGFVSNPSALVPHSVGLATGVNGNVVPADDGGDHYLFVCIKCNRQSTNEVCEKICSDEDGVLRCKLRPRDGQLVDDMEDLVMPMTPKIYVDGRRKTTGRMLYENLQALHTQHERMKARAACHGAGPHSHTDELLSPASRECPNAVRSRLRIVPVNCLSMCHLGNVIAISGPGKFGYQFGAMHENDSEDMQAILQFAEDYIESSEGFTKNKTRPARLSRNILARIPPPLPTFTSLADAYDKSVQGSTVLRMSTPESIKRYIGAVLIPVIANVRIGHLSEAKIMESIGVNLIDESDLLTSAEVPNISSKRELGIPTICAVTSLKECLLRIQEGALILRVKGTRDGGNISEALKYLLAIRSAIDGMRADPPTDTTLYADASIFKPLLDEVVRTGRLPVPLFGSGGIHTPSDVAIMMENGCDGVFVDTAVFLGLDPETHLKAIMQATKDYKNTSKMCELSNYFI
ncbi:hypothetical protein GGH13_004980 [Coemansia sp. S155-1]|nr:hypothetical protein GGH13_004980 [Coemansia sp. S155-1]